MGTHLALPSLSAEASVGGRGVARCAGDAGFEFVSDSEISAWLPTGPKGREIKNALLLGNYLSVWSRSC